MEARRKRQLCNNLQSTTFLTKRLQSVKHFLATTLAKTTNKQLQVKTHLFLSTLSFWNLNLKTQLMLKTVFKTLKIKNHQIKENMFMMVNQSVQELIVSKVKISEDKLVINKPKVLLLEMKERRILGIMKLKRLINLNSIVNNWVKVTTFYLKILTKIPMLNRILRTNTKAILLAMSQIIKLPKTFWR